jgi:hypothetical protein
MKFLSSKPEMSSQDPLPRQGAGTAASPALLRPHRPKLLLIGTMMLTLLTAAAVFAANKPGGNMDKSRLEHGQKFENAHPPTHEDSLEARRDSAAWVERKGRPRHGNPTFMNRKMMGHSKHEDRPSRTETNAKEWQNKRMWRQNGTWQGSATWLGSRATDWQNERASWPQRGGYGGAFVSQADYDRHFSTAHDFRLKSQPDMKRGYPHFKRDGVHFMMVDPYPQHWNEKWHETDDVYIQYDQGYYLHNRRDPAHAIAVMVLQ